MTRLLLASSSETRRRMLKDAGISFDARAASIDEEAAKKELLIHGASPLEIAIGLAAAKARSIKADGGVLVLGSDQVLEQEDGSILNKAGSREEAATQLRNLSGRSHKLHSAAALAEGGRVTWRAQETVTLHMRALSEPSIEQYLSTEFDQVRYNVGVYRIEGPGVQLFDSIEGSHFAILGMPLLPLLGELRRRGILAS